MTASLVGMGQIRGVAVFSSNLMVSLADKIISAFIALAVIEALPPALTAHLDICKAPKLQLVLWIALASVLATALAVFVASAG